MENTIISDVDIKSILANECIAPHFQPIFSIKDSKIIGFEALARATDPNTQKPIPPNILFEYASRQGLLLELDRHCRRKAIDSFSKFQAAEDTSLLFINLDSSILNREIVGSNNFIKLVKEYNINPERIVIEFIESKVNDTQSLRKFIEIHRNYGFIIAIDDLGTGHSNLERIPSMKPDIIKLDRSLISDIHKEYHKQELFDFFIKLAHKIGVLVIAEGIESIDETFTCLEHGADLVQGFYFEKPQHPNNFNIFDSLQKIITTNALFKDYIKAQFEKRKKKYSEFDQIANFICAHVSQVKSEKYDTELSEVISKFHVVECAYILHETGIQISSTIFNPTLNHRTRSSLFAPADFGCDQSSKDYFLFLSQTQTRYVTDPYISKASGNVCITIASMVYCNNNTKIVVCIDIAISE